MGKRPQRTGEHMRDAAGLIAWPAFVVAMLAMVLTMAGCQAQPPRDTLAALTIAENTLTNAAQALGTALQLGTLDANNRDYAQIYRALEQANAILDAAWDTWRAGNGARAEVQADQALAAYEVIRPLLMRYAQ